MNSLCPFNLGWRELPSKFASSSKGGIYHVLYRLLYLLLGFAVLESKQQHGGNDGFHPLFSCRVLKTTDCLTHSDNMFLNATNLSREN